MRKIFACLLPQEESTQRAPAVHKPALAIYILALLSLYLFLNLYKGVVPGVLGFASSIFVDQVVGLTNQYRQEMGFSTLRLDPVLSEAARQKAEDMFADGYWAHVAPDGTTPWDFIRTAGYEYVYAGENLAKDFQDSEKVVAAWMDSPSHRQNVLNGNYRDIGVAVVNGTLNGYETTLVVQMFGQKVTTLAALPTSSTLIPTPALEVKPKLAPATPPAAATTGAAGGWVLSAPSRPEIDVFALTRGVSLSLGVLVMGFFLADAYTAKRRGLVRITGHTLAHLTILLFLLGMTYFIKPGAIL